jgi:hypothetical protein
LPRQLKAELILLLLGVAVVFVGVPCPLHLTTGFYCPGCGTGRLFWNLAQGQLVASYYANQLVFILLPVLVLIYLHHLYFMIRQRHLVSPKLQTVVYIILSVLLIAFGILRNIPGFETLQPR